MSHTRILKGIPHVMGAATALLVCVFLSVNTDLSAEGSSAGVTVTPLISFPVGPSADLFNVGYGARLSGEFPLTASVALDAGLQYSVHPTLAQTNLSLIALGGGISTTLPIVQPLSFEASVDAGAYAGLYDQQFTANPFVSGHARLRVAFSPSTSLSGGVGYDYFLTNSNGAISALYNGFQATIGLQFQPGLSTSAQRQPKLQIQDPFYRPVFPVFFKYYDRNAFGKVTLKNLESGSISNVKVTVLVDQYMAGPRVSLIIPNMKQSESIDVPLTALFTDSVLSITEPTSVSIKLNVSYTVDDTPLVVTRNDTLRVLDRNALTWDDDRKVASFVTSRDPTVLQFARQVSSATREVGTTEVNENLRSAMAIFTALNLYGVDYAIDPKSSYADLSQSAASIDYVQFPVQTLQFKAGDCDDLSVLYASLLEAVGIESAFLTVPGHIFTAFSLGTSMADAARVFGKATDIIEHEGKAWLPVEITLVDRDFLQAWSTGAREWREADLAGKAAFYPVRTAWQTYEPTGFSSTAQTLKIPEDQKIAVAYRDRLTQFVERQIGPQVEDLKSRISASGGNARLVNKLGTVYARFGMYDKALAQFRAAAAQNYAQAVINIGNIEFLNKDFKQALTNYTKAQRMDPSEPLAALAIARTEYEIGSYAEAQIQYRKAVAMAPELSAPFSYIVSESKEIGRASDTSGRTSISWGDR